MTQATLEELKDKASELGVRFGKNTTAEELKERIEAAIAKEEKARIKKVAENDPLRLVRVVVSPMDPVKKDYTGEIFTVSNGVVGTIRRFIPFNNENGWHIEWILYQMLKNKKFQYFTTKKGERGRTVSAANLAPAYNVIVLDDLTEEELAKLAQEQAARNSID